jgi:hypothetical protein
MNVTTPATNSRTGFAFGQIEQKSPLAGAAAALTDAVIVPPPAAWAAATVRTFAAISIANCFESKGIVFSSCISNMPSKTARTYQTLANFSGASDEPIQCLGYPLPAKYDFPKSLLARAWLMCILTEIVLSI